MIKQVMITNHLGESLTMELRFPEKSGFLVLGIDGLDPSKADINKTELASGDGAQYNSSHVQSRNVVFTLGFSENFSIEDLRHASYRYFPIKRQINIQVETDSRLTGVDGYVESNAVNIFSKNEGAVISVICPDAYLYSLETQNTVFSFTEALFEFPFSNEDASTPLIELGNLHINSTKTIVYEGDAPVGITMYIHATGTVNNLTISNVDTRETMAINSARLITMTGADISAGDDIVISTVKGHKYATLYRGGLSINIFNALDKYPDWFQLEKGDNVFTYAADSGSENLQFRIENKVAYEGI